MPNPGPKADYYISQKYDNRQSLKNENETVLVGVGKRPQKHFGAGLSVFQKLDKKLANKFKKAFNPRYFNHTDGNNNLGKKSYTHNLPRNISAVITQRISNRDQHQYTHHSSCDRNQTRALMRNYFHADDLDPFLNKRHDEQLSNSFAV